MFGVFASLLFAARNFHSFLVQSFNEVADVIVFVRMRIDTPVDVCIRVHCEFVPNAMYSFHSKRPLFLPLEKTYLCISVRELTVKCDCDQFIAIRITNILVDIPSNLYLNLMRNSQIRVDFSVVTENLTTAVK